MTITPTRVDTGRSAIPEQRTGPAAAGCDDSPCAQTLWDALILTRVTSPVISAAADAVFRFYLPLAHTLARQHASPSADAALADLVAQAAELGLANAVLAWRHPDSREFTAFARGAITAQIRRTQDTRWLGPWPLVPPKAAGNTAVPI